MAANASKTRNVGLWRTETALLSFPTTTGVSVLTSGTDDEKKIMSTGDAVPASDASRGSTVLSPSCESPETRIPIQTSQSPQNLMSPVISPPKVSEEQNDVKYLMKLRL